MPYRNLHFTSLAKDLAIRTEIYNGEEHLVVPCVALVGDEVVYGMNAEGPEFIPAEELEFSTLGWSGRPVLPDHPSNSTSTANDPHTLQLMQFGQIFYPKFEDRKLKVEAWLGKERAKKVEGAPEVIQRAENGEMIELSVGAIISLEKKKGVSPSGKPFDSKWRDIIGDHLAIGLRGMRGACNLEMGCGANRTLSCNSGGSDEVRSMRAMRGVDDMNDAPTDKPADKAMDQPAAKPVQSKVQKILSFASRIFRSNTEDEGLSDGDLRSKLWDALYSTEPAFYGIEDVFQESMTVKYVTQPVVPTPTMYLWRRSFTIADDGTVTINDDREEVSKVENSFMFLASPAAERINTDAIPCSCHDKQNEQPTSETHVLSKEDDQMADTPNTNPNPSTPGQPTAPSTPAAPSAPTTPAAPSTPDTKSEDETETTPAGTNPTASSVTNQQLQALIEAHPVVKHYRAQEAQEKASLVSALTKKQKVFTAEELNAEPIEKLRKMAEFAGVNPAHNTIVADYSGRVLVSADHTEDEVRKPPKGITLALNKQKGVTTTGEKAN